MLFDVWSCGRYDTEQVWRYFSFYTTGQGTKWLYHICLVCELLSWDLLTRNIFGFRILIAVWNTLQSDLRSSYFTKGTNDLKESSTKEKTPISGLAFHTLAPGVVLFVPSRSSRDHFLNGQNSATVQPMKNFQFVVWQASSPKKTLHHKRQKKWHEKLGQKLESFL